MRALIFTDAQAGEGSERCFHDPGLPLQRYRIRMLFEILHEIFVNYQCDALWEGGDLTDDRTAIPIPTLDVMFNGLKPFRPSANRNYKIIGNHEQFVRSGSIHVGAPFEGIFNVIDSPSVRIIDDVCVIFCPYPGEDFPVEDWLKAKLEEARNPTLVFGHFQVEGTKDRDGRVLKGGVHTGILKEADLVLLGHVHHPQSITDKIHYIGSPFQQDFGEAGEEKRVAVLDLPSLELEWVSMEGFPTYSVLSLDEWEPLIDQDVGSENRYRVVLSTKEEHERYLQHPQIRRATPIYQGLGAALADRINAPRVGQISFDANDVLKRFFKSRPPSQMHGLNEQEFLQVGLDLLET